MSNTAVSYTLAHVVIMPMMLIAVYHWLRQWGSVPLALLGTMVMIAYLPLMFMIDYGIGLWSMTELLLLCAGLLLIKRPVPFAIVVILASLNRETAVLLPVAWFLWHFPTLKQGHGWQWPLLYFAIWAILFVGLRLVIGSRPPMFTFEETLSANIETLPRTLINAFFILPTTIFMFWGWRASSPELKRLAVIIPLYVGICAVFALWNEVRLVLSLVPFTMPFFIKALEPTNHVPIHS